MNSAEVLWRHRRLVWWVFVMNLVIAWLSSLPARVMLSSVLDRSLESAKLVTGFNLPAMALMVERPDVAARPVLSGAFGATLLFLLYLLFIDGGVVTVFLEDRKLSTAEFFENCGLFFWRMVRLALYSIVPFGLLAAVHSSVHHFADKLSKDAPQEKLGFFVDAGGILLIVLLALFVRMWFDVAQVYVVRDNERQLLRTTARSFKQAWKWKRLYAKYVAIGLFAAATFAIGAGAWVFVPHSATGVSFILLELVTLAEIAARLWMKAATATWVGMRLNELPITLPATLQEIDPTQAPPPLPDPGYSQ